VGRSGDGQRLVGRRRFLESLSASLSQAEPFPLKVRKTAAVSVIFRMTGGKEEVLMIQRAERVGDPWSGQVAFPGGRVDSADGSFMEAAVRETEEEVGVRLGQSSRFLGYMEGVNARNRDVTVVPSVFELTGEATPTLSREVASTFWLPLAELLVKENRSVYVLERDGKRVGLPSFVYQGLVIWGLTERILSAIVEGR
jgi:8-oxo-dGTP pyrophosphatase MutT (NUDIX family)